MTRPDFSKVTDTWVAIFNPVEMGHFVKLAKSCPKGWTIGHKDVADSIGAMTVMCSEETGEKLLEAVREWNRARAKEAT